MKNVSIEKIKEFWLKYEQKIVLVIGFCLVSAVSFGFGVLQGEKWQQKPLIIEKQANTPADAQNAQDGQIPATQANSNSSNLKANVASEAKSSPCAFVGSKNSTKFYVPTCSWAKRIKPENMVCYKSEQEALVKGKIKSDCK